MESMEIAMLSIHSNPAEELGSKNNGGMSVYIRELSRELSRCGHRVDVYSHSRNGDGTWVLPLGDNVRLVHLGPAGAGGDLAKGTFYHHLGDFFRELEKFRRRERLNYDLIHSHYWLSGRIGCWARERWRRPHVMMFHTLGILKNRTATGKPEAVMRIPTEKFLAGTSERVLAATRPERESLMRDYRAGGDRIAVVPCGVNLRRFRPLGKSWARRRLGLDPLVPLLLYVGRFDPVKGLNRVLLAMAELADDFNGRLMMIGGDGPLSPETRRLQRLAGALGVGGRVDFLGSLRQEQLLPYYSAADLVLVPSFYESFGLAGLEALACGTPVVATPVGAMPEILRDGLNGHVVDDYSPSALARGIRETLDRRQRFSPERIRATVLDYGWRQVAATVVTEYRACLDRRMPADDRRRPRRAAAGLA
jgi:D-inositol-3-phosphate glycosyltransferase